MNKARLPVVHSSDITYPYHHESSALVNTTAEILFQHVDDHSRLSSHMSRSSWMMGGGKMTVETDEGQGRKIGSRIRVAGRACGMLLELEEIVTEHSPPRRKIWETIGQPRLLIIGGYQMGFDITPRPDGSLFRVYIDYALPRSATGRLLGRLFGKFYAQWCTESMVNDAVRRFASIKTA